MTIRQFFVDRAVVFALLLVFGAGLISYTYLFLDSSPSATVVFTWELTDHPTLKNLDGAPYTNVVLEAAYANGAVDRKLIDTVPMSCNALPESSADTVATATDIQCYGAGAGYRYRVTRGEHTYRVERLEFEEALPDSNPEPHGYEVVSEFSL